MRTHVETRRALALAAMLAAGVGSLASTSSPDEAGTWTLEESAGGPPLLLTAEAPTAEKHILVGVSGEGTSAGDFVTGSMLFDAASCTSGGAAGGVRLRVMFIPDDPTASGEVLEREVPECPAVEAFDSHQSVLGNCTDGQPCTAGFTAVFDRIAAADTAGSIEVSWTVGASITGEGETDMPPSGTEVILEIEQ